MRGLGSKVSMKLILDDVCGTTKDDFKNMRLFQNHYRTHADELLKCPECPAIWSEGPETMFNTKRQLITHMYRYHSNSNDCNQCDKSTLQETL